MVNPDDSEIPSLRDQCPKSTRGCGASPLVPEKGHIRQERCHVPEALQPHDLMIYDLGLYEAGLLFFSCFHFVPPDPQPPISVIETKDVMIAGRQ